MWGHDTITHRLWINPKHPDTQQTDGTAGDEQDRDSAFTPGRHAAYWPAGCNTSCMPQPPTRNSATQLTSDCSPCYPAKAAKDGNNSQQTAMCCLLKNN
ncbi:MAG: hypothetical protein PVF82_07730, partial [Gammaproteobacteria bacterium]